MIGINIKGTYIIKQEDTIILQGENLITVQGEWFFLNRCINNSYNPIKYIVIGNGQSPPMKTGTELGNETLRRICTKEADLDNKCIRLKGSFTSSEIVGTTEIGVCCLNSNDTPILISHDVFTKIDNTLLTNLSGSVEIEYLFQFSTSTIRTGWTQVTTQGFHNTYYLYEPNEVNGVIQDNVHGYKNVKTKEAVEKNNGSYFYDTVTQNLYINTVKKDTSSTTENTSSDNPNNHIILIQTGKIQE